MNADWRSRYQKALEITRAAGQVALQYFDTPLKVDLKGDQSPVTIADRETEMTLRQGLEQAFPGDGFLGEEFGETPNSTGFRWILDPIDGTRAFVRGIPLWATLVGLEYRGELIAGIVDAPALGHTYHALRGNGAYRNTRKISVSDQSDLSRAILFYSSLAWFLKANKEKEFTELVRRTEKQRGYGDWYGFLLVAQGSGEIMIEHGVHAWDVAGILPIVEEAGGRMTAWNGKFELFAPDVIATNGKLHEQVLAIVHGKGT